MKRYLYILAHLALISSLACLLIGCGSSSPDEPTPVGPEQPVTPQNPEEKEYPLGFYPSANKESESRADNYVPLENKYSLFKVWAYKSMPEDEEVQTVMPGYQVKFLGWIDRWQYDGNTFVSHNELNSQFLKYWDGSAEKYAFHAYAPVTPDDEVTASTKGLTIPGIVEAHKQEKDIPDKFKDLVIARHTRNFAITQLGLCDVDELSSKPFPSINNFYEAVPLRFHHPFAKVEFRIFNDGEMDAEITDLKVNFTHNLPIGGRYEDGQWSSPTLMTDFSFVSVSSLSVPMTNNTKEKAITAYGPTLELPQLFPIDPEKPFQFLISMTVNGQEIPQTAYTMEGGWESDTCYIYYIKITAADLTIILVDLDVEAFAYGGKVDITQTNW